MSGESGLADQLERWEYLTRVLRAEGATGRKHAPEHLQPQLDALGADRWELVSLTPARLGRDFDVHVAGGDVTHWSSDYLGVFKRRVGGA